jgi:small subunit ribosomal protein S8
MTHDTISDFIIQIKNGSSAKKESVLIPYSNLKFAIAQKLSEKGYVKTPVKKGKKVTKFVEVGLIYSEDGAPRISDLARLSKPSKRLYIGSAEIRPVKQGYGSLILSTPQGIMSDDEARKAKVGGEILFKIW